MSCFFRFMSATLIICGSGFSAEPVVVTPALQPPLAVPVVQVRVRADTVRSINGASAVPEGLFGVTAYEGASAATEMGLQEVLRSSGIRWAGLPAHSTWTFGEQLPEGFANGWANGAAATAKLDGPSPGYHIPRAVRGWRDLGIEPMLYLLEYPEQLNGGISPDGTVKIPDYPKDIPAAARMWAEYVAWVRRADPDLTWLHLGNESNASWWKLEKYGKDYAEVFNAVAVAVKARNPGVRIGGPVPCWAPSWPPAQAGTSDWYTWDQWTAPFIASSGKHLDFFDFHLYEAGAGIGNEEVQTVANAMWLATGERKPVLITEYGVYLKPEDLLSSARVWNRRIEPWQQQVMDFLDFQADTVLSLQPHDLFAEASGQFAFLKGIDPADQFPLYRAYQTWAPFQGVRLECASDRAAVRAFAARSSQAVDGGQALAVVLVNTTGETHEVALTLDGAVLRPGPVRQRLLRMIPAAGSATSGPAAGREGFQNAAQGGVNGGPVTDTTPQQENAVVVADTSRIEYAEVFSDRVPEAVTLAPHETRSLLVPVAAGTSGQESWTRTVFGDVVQRDFAKPGDSCVVLFKPPAEPAQSATLRVGLLGARAGDRVEVSIAGTTIVLTNQWFQEVPLPRVPSPKAGVVTATFTLISRGSPTERPLLLRFGSAVLAYRGEGPLKPIPALSVPVNAPAVATWSFVPRSATASALENPWSGAVQSVTNLALDLALVPGPATDGRLVASAQGGVERSPASSILFRAPRTGWYRIGCAGALTKRSNHTAGHALMTIYTLPRGGQAMRELAGLPLNTKGGFGDHPAEFTWAGQVWLRAGWQVGVGLQVVSPGPANGGQAELKLTRLVGEFLGAGR